MTPDLKNKKNVAKPIGIDTIFPPEDLGTRVRRLFEKRLNEITSLNLLQTTITKFI
jgi:hypothetical protein